MCLGKDRLILMKLTTLCFLVKRKEGKIIEVCLGEKKTGFGKGVINAAGGKAEPGEEIIQAAIRETQEEFGVMPKNILKVGEFDFSLPHEDEWNSISMHAFMTDQWDGE